MKKLRLIFSAFLCEFFNLFLNENKTKNCDIKQNTFSFIVYLGKKLIKKK